MPTVFDHLRYKGGRKRIQSLTVCECGQPAVKVRYKAGVCARCLALEARYKQWWGAHTPPRHEIYQEPYRVLGETPLTLNSPTLYDDPLH